MTRRLWIVAACAAGIGLGGAAQALTPLEQLGRNIYFDANLSLNGNQACASCHAPGAGWVGPTSTVNAGGAVYQGSVDGAFGNRKPPSAAYATPSPILQYTRQGGGLFVGGNFWDGRATGERLGSPAAEQALGPFLNPAEQALALPWDVVSRICDSGYGDQFRELWTPVLGDPCVPANVAKAYDAVGFSIAAYEASPEVNAFSSKYDAWLKGLAVLTAEEFQGFELFNGKAKCARCHVNKGKKALLTDYTFDNLGVPRNPANPFYTQAANLDGWDWVDPGLGGFLASRADYAALAGAHYGAHKVPTLRNVDARPSADPDFVKAYGHNGYFKSLWSIVHFYNTRDVKPVCSNPFTTEADALLQGCWPAPEEPANLNMKELGDLGLTPAEENAIVAYLTTLTDGWVPPP